MLLCLVGALLIEILKPEDVFVLRTRQLGASFPFWVVLQRVAVLGHADGSRVLHVARSLWRCGLVAPLRAGSIVGFLRSILCHEYQLIAVRVAADGVLQR